MAALDKNVFGQVYNAREGVDLPLAVTQVVCALVERGIMVSGFDAAGNLLVIQYSGYGTAKPVWALDFFEQVFIQETLLAKKEKVKGVFILGDRNLIIPDALYDGQEARKWLRRIHYVEAKETIESFPLVAHKATYLYAVSMGFAELVKINFKQASILALPAYHFRNAAREGTSLQCCLFAGQACTTLHHNGQLLWHRVFGYACAEDVAYGIKQLCMENGIPPAQITFTCDAVSAAQFDVLIKLSQYFPGTASGKGAITGNWDAAISLSQLLFECVS